jgi:hypothetical protein
MLSVGGGKAALLVVSAAIYVPILRKGGAGVLAPWAAKNPPVPSPEPSFPSAAPAVPLDVDKELAAAESEAKGDDHAAAGKACRARDLVKERLRGTSYQRKVDDRLAVCP